MAPRSGAELHPPRGVRGGRALRSRRRERVDFGLGERHPEGGLAAELLVGGQQLLADLGEPEVGVVDAVDVERRVGAGEARSRRRAVFDLVDRASRSSPSRARELARRRGTGPRSRRPARSARAACCSSNSVGSSQALRRFDRRPHLRRVEPGAPPRQPVRHRRPRRLASPPPPSSSDPRGSAARGLRTRGLRARSASSAGLEWRGLAASRQRRTRPRTASASDAGDPAARYRLRRPWCLGSRAGRPRTRAARSAGSLAPEPFAP